MVKYEYLFRKRIHTSWVPSPTQKNIHKIKRKKEVKIDVRQARMCTGDQASEGGVEGEEGASGSQE